MKLACSVILTFCVVLSLSGCGNGKSSAEEKALQTMRQSFDAAPPELKEKYAGLQTAVTGSDFAKAKTLLEELGQAQLSTEQAQAVEEQKQAIVLKASIASQNGDANALQFIQSMRAGSRGR